MEARVTLSVAAIVVAYDGGAGSHACTDSLLSQTIAGLEIIVVDNASTDGAIHALDSEFGTHVLMSRRLPRSPWRLGTASAAGARPASRTEQVVCGAAKSGSWPRSWAARIW